MKKCVLFIFQTQSISIVKNILSCSYIDFFSIHAIFHAWKSLKRTYPGFEPVMPLLIYLCDNITILKQYLYYHRTKANKQKFWSLLQSSVSECKQMSAGQQIFLKSKGL